MSERIIIQSHKGLYAVDFDENAFSHLNSDISNAFYYIIDAKVARIYGDELLNVLSSPSVLKIEVTETNKTLEKFPDYVSKLVANGIRRGHTLVAIGGGIIQDIAAFLATTLFRGLEWNFYPTTLLAQADSCIGSKSSINVGGIKNVLGTYHPPSQIVISTRVLATLDEQDICSGVGEMLKVHIIDGPSSFDGIAQNYTEIFIDSNLMRKYIKRSLEIKRPFVEQDEFDRGVRNVLNYGHSFGHAIEAATDFGVPHGIGITIGMDMANYMSCRMNLMDRMHYDRMHRILARNYAGFENVEVPINAFMAAIAKDKKNTSNKLKLVLPDAEARITLGLYNNDDNFRSICVDYLANERCI